MGIVMMLQAAKINSVLYPRAANMTGQRSVNHCVSC